MGETVKLTANDGHSFDAYVARPADQPKAGIVVVQEIFGVNVHVRGLADGFAADGYLAVAPALFDRVERGRSEEHTSELQSLMRISYAVFCLKKKKIHQQTPTPKFKHT